MNKQRISKYLMALSILTFFAIFFFIVQTSYTKLIKPTEDISKSSLLKPLDPDFDTTIIDQIEQRPYYTNNNLISDQQPTGIPIPTPSL